MAYKKVYTEEELGLDGFWDSLWGGVKTAAKGASDVYQMQKLQAGQQVPGMPGGAAVPYQPPSFFEQNKMLIILGGAGLVLAILLLSKKKKKSE